MACRLVGTQAIISTNDGILLIVPLGTNFSEILIKIYTFSFKKMHLKMLFDKWRPICLGLNVLIYVSCHRSKLELVIAEDLFEQVIFFNLSNITMASVNSPVHYTTSLTDHYDTLIKITETEIPSCWLHFHHQLHCQLSTSGAARASDENFINMAVFLFHWFQYKYPHFLPRKCP